MAWANVRLQGEWSGQKATLEESWGMGRNHSPVGWINNGGPYPPTGDASYTKGGEARNTSGGLSELSFAGRGGLCDRLAPSTRFRSLRRRSENSGHLSKL
jgi:hypothetical protein